MKFSLVPGRDAEARRRAAACSIHVHREVVSHLAAEITLFSAHTHPQACLVKTNANKAHRQSSIEIYEQKYIKYFSLRLYLIILTPFIISFVFSPSFLPHCAVK
jgi:hypothetical protein